MPFRVNGLLTLFVNPSDFRNFAVLNGDIAAVTRAARAVHHHPIFDDQVVSHTDLLSSLRSAILAPWDTRGRM